MKDLIEKFIENPQAIIASLAFLISLISIIFTYKMFHLQKKHNLKSVKPIGLISVGDYEHNIFVRIDNNGVGPMIIKSFKAFSPTVSSDKSLIDIIPVNISHNVFWKDFDSNIGNKTIKVGSSINLLQLAIEEIKEIPDNHEEMKNKLREFLKNVIIEITYTDIYDSEIFHEKLQLTWFGRD